MEGSWPPSANLPTRNEPTTDDMKNQIFFYFIFAALTVSCGSKNDILLELSNPMDQPRADAAILLTRNEIANWIGIPDGKLPLLLNENEIPIPCQLDDVDGDGQWDELFALTDLPASGQMTAILRLVSAAEFPVFQTRTNLRLGDASKPGYPELASAQRLEGVSYDNYDHRTDSAFQMEGVAWENDRIGFRNYMDQRNGIDIFGKLTVEMVLDSVGVAGRPSYHEPAAWGMDILKVGTSLGAGAIGYLYDDSIYRVGDNGSGSYQVLFEGPLRSRFLLTYSNWMVDGSPLEVSQQVEITAGRHYYQSWVTCRGTLTKVQLVPGIVNMKSDSLHILSLNDHYTALLTLDNQAEDSSMLAMALVVPSGEMRKVGETMDTGEGITQTYYAVLETTEGQPVPYRFYALWEMEDPAWASLDQVARFLESEAERGTQSLIIRVLN
jgi:hypothetical protein